MATLILDKTVELLSSLIFTLESQIKEDEYYDSEYQNYLDDRFSRYGF